MFCIVLWSHWVLDSVLLFCFVGYYDIIDPQGVSQTETNRFSSSRLIHIPNPRGRYHLLDGKSTASTPNNSKCFFSPENLWTHSFLVSPMWDVGPAQQIGQIGQIGLRSLENIWQCQSWRWPFLPRWAVSQQEKTPRRSMPAVSPCVTTEFSSCTPQFQPTHCLVGGFNQPLWKMMEWVRQLGWFFHSQLIWKVIQSSHVPDPTKQISH